MLNSLCANVGKDPNNLHDVPLNVAIRSQFTSDCSRASRGTLLNEPAARLIPCQIHVLSNSTLCVGISNQDPSNNWATKLQVLVHLRSKNTCSTSVWRTDSSLSKQGRRALLKISHFSTSFPTFWQTSDYQASSISWHKVVRIDRLTVLD